MAELAWGILLAGYLFLGGMAGGAFTIGALADLFEKERYKVLSKSGVYVSLVSIIAGLVLLVIDLKRFEVAPLSPLNAYIRFPASIMSVGTWIITAFTVVALATAILWFFEGLSALRKLMEIAGIVLGISTAAYTGLLLSFARGHPFWSSPYLPWLFVISGTVTGLAMALVAIPLLAILTPRFFREFKEFYENTADVVGMSGHMERYGRALTVIEIALVALYIGATPTTGILLMGAAISLWFYAYVAVGLVAPLGIGYYVSKRENAGPRRSTMMLIVGGNILALIGGFLLRYVVLTAGQLIF